MGGKGSGGLSGGRKRKSEEGRVSFSVSCTKEERELIKTIADKRGMTISQIVIYSVLEYENSKNNNLL